LTKITTCVFVAADGDDGQGESIAISIPANIDDANDAGGGEATYITMPRADGSDGTIAMETSDDVRFIKYFQWPETFIFSFRSF